MYLYGIEYEVGLARAGRFLDFSNTRSAELQSIIDELPRYKEDVNRLKVGDAGIKVKRWYLEGFERYNREGKVIDSPTKGIEIRTSPQPSIDACAAELRCSYQLLAQRLAHRDISIVHTARNPFLEAFVPDPPLQPWELSLRSSNEDQTAYLHMVTYGPDVSISNSDWSTEEVIAKTKKLVHYGPYIAAISANSPFKNGRLTGNKSERILYRNGLRPMAWCYVPSTQDLVPGLNPTLTSVARLSLEAGRIEFKGLDCVPSLDFYGAVLALIKGIALSDQLAAARETPDSTLLVHIAQTGLDDDAIYETVQTMVGAAKAELDESEKHLLAPIEAILSSRQTYADKLIGEYQTCADIMQLLKKQQVT